MPFFTKKPVKIEARQYTDRNSGEAIRSWASDGERDVRVEDSALFIQTLEGEMRADIGDWIIKGVDGEIYPCKPDIFDRTYEPA